MLDVKVAESQEAAKRRYDVSAHALPPLKVGQSVRLQDPVTKRWGSVGVVVGVGKHRDNHVKMPSGRVMWRNRRFLRPAFVSEPQGEAQEFELAECKDRKLDRVLDQGQGAVSKKTVSFKDFDKAEPRRSKHNEGKPVLSYKN